MNRYLTNLTKPRIIKEDFPEEVIHWPKAEGKVLGEGDMGTEERSIKSCHWHVMTCDPANDES